MDDDELAHLVVDVIWSQDFKCLDVTVHCDFTLLEFFSHLLLGIHSHELNLVVKVSLGLRILDPVYDCMVDEALGSGKEDSVVEHLGVRHDEVDAEVLCDQGLLGVLVELLHLALVQLKHQKEGLVHF